MNEQSPLLALVTGMAHSGTTLLSQLIIANHKPVDAGFECGVLLSRESPRKFYEVMPFYEWFLGKKEAGHWGMRASDLAYACDTEDWFTFYHRIIERCELMQGKTAILDKTPRYIFHLGEIMEKAAQIPVFITVKSLDLLYFSYKKRGVDRAAFQHRLEKAARSYAQQKAAANIQLVYHHDLCQQPEKSMQRVFETLNLPLPPTWQKQVDRQLQPLTKRFDLEAERQLAQSHFSPDDRAFLREIRPAYNSLWKLTE